MADKVAVLIPCYNEAITILLEYAQTGLAPRIPTILASIVLAGCVVLSFATGLVLDTVANSNRRHWELDVYKADYNHKYKQS